MSTPATPGTSPSYRFRSEWTVPARLADGPEAVYDLLEDVAEYPSWWRSVTAVGRLAEDAALVVCRSRLPKTLHLVLRPEVQDRRRHLLRAAISGELEGWSEFALRRSSAGVEVTYRQEVETTGRLLGWAGRVARPALVWNHEQMMVALQEDLQARLAGEA